MKWYIVDANGKPYIYKDGSIAKFDSQEQAEDSLSWINPRFIGDEWYIEEGEDDKFELYEMESEC